MKSPFPGMDPFIEARGGLWKDFHDKLIGEIERALAPQLPENYVVRTGERSYVERIDVEKPNRFVIEPDVAINVAWQRDTESPGSSSPQSAAVAELEPVTMEALLDAEAREVFLEIYELHPERRLVTVIEVLSPSNKRPGTAGWRQYDRKRQAMLSGEVHFVEIDLLREGERLPMSGKWPPTPYYLLVSRRQFAPACKVWPATSLRPLPEIPIPLAPPDSDVMLNLQPLVDEVYSRARYHLDIDYKQVSATLDANEVAWLKGVMGRRE